VFGGGKSAPVTYVYHEGRIAVCLLPLQSGAYLGKLPLIRVSSTKCSDTRR
jgi:hypothetical protein